MPRYKGAHLTWNDRLTIEKMLREGYSKPQIARYLGVHHSTVYDECRRGAVELKRSDLTTYISYSADVAKDYHLDRKKNMEKPLKIGKDHRLARWLVKPSPRGIPRLLPVPCWAKRRRPPSPAHYAVRLCISTSRTGTCGP